MAKMMLQGFEWYLKPEDKHWNRIKDNAKFYKDLGVTDIWLPPASKGHRGLYDSGYGVYDLYDLGEFHQKGSLSTKYGTLEEYLQAVKSLKDHGIGVIVDIVLNHRIGADDCETLQASSVNPSNRNQVIENKKIMAWTKFDFEARSNKYSNFKWNHNHFTGIDYDALNNISGVYLFEGKTWDSYLSLENGNYDYLMGADVDFRNPQVIEELKHYLTWYKDFIGFSGIRLDAIKHINANKMKELIEHIQKESDVFSVGEYWSPNTQELIEYLHLTNFKTTLFDVPLHHKLFDLSYGRLKDIRNIFDGTLSELYPTYAVAFVDNHDTQVGQSLESWIAPWFRPHANAFILLYKTQFPCVFFTDAKDPFIQSMMRLRKDNRIGRFMEFNVQENLVVFGYDDENGYLCCVNSGESQSFEIRLNKNFAQRRYTSLDGKYSSIVDGEGLLSISCDALNVTLYKVEGK